MSFLENAWTKDSEATALNDFFSMHMHISFIHSTVHTYVYNTIQFLYIIMRCGIWETTLLRICEVGSMQRHKDKWASLAMRSTLCSRRFRSLDGWWKHDLAPLRHMTVELIKEKDNLQIWKWCVGL